MLLVFLNGGSGSESVVLDVDERDGWYIRSMWTDDLVKAGVSQWMQDAFIEATGRLWRTDVQRLI